MQAPFHGGRFTSRNRWATTVPAEPRSADLAHSAFCQSAGVYDFQKRTSLIEVSAAGAVTLGKIASVLAHGEGLQAHARSAELRLESQQ